MSLTTNSGSFSDEPFQPSSERPDALYARQWATHREHQESSSARMKVNDRLDLPTPMRG